MTQVENGNADAEIGAARPSSVGRRLAARWFPAVLFGLMAVLAAGDLFFDAAQGAGALHVGMELVEVTLSLAGVVFIWTQLRSAEARAHGLQRDLEGTRADLARWRAEAQDHLRVLGVAIDGQFERWGLTPAEREVALLLLKGLSLKEIADLRETSDRTVRQQSLGIYRKAGITGRAELAAFFLEDLLLPGAASTASGAVST